MIEIIADKDYRNVQVNSDSLGKLDELLNYMKRKIYESIGRYVSVLDLHEWAGVAFLYTDAEMMNWVWTSLEKAKIGRDIDCYVLSMPPARKRGMINQNLHLTPPPQPYIPRKELEIYNKVDTYSFRIEPAPIKIPTREEIAASIKVYEDYNIDEDAYKLCYVYKDRVTDHTFHQLHVVKRVDHILEDEVRHEMWDKAWREELISAVMKDYEVKKKEQEKEKLNMFLNNYDAIYEKIRKYASNFEIESTSGELSTATIECPVHLLNGLLGLENNTAKKPKPVSNVEITNIEVYNDRAVKVTFDDGSFTKSVCQENDIFDLDVGITVCLMKKMLDDGKGNGTRIYNDIIRNAHKLINDKENEKIKQQMEKEKQKKKAHKAMMKKKAKKLKAKEEAIDIQKQAFIRAMQETGMTGNVD